MTGEKEVAGKVNKSPDGKEIDKIQLRKVMVESCVNFASSFCEPEECETCEDIDYQMEQVIKFLENDH